jgi:hypothetical protein
MKTLSLISLSILINLFFFNNTFSQDTIYYTGFEDVEIETLNHTTASINGEKGWDYSSTNNAMIDFNTFNYNGNKSACLAASSPNVYPNAINYLTLTADPTSYSNINLSFYIFFNSEEQNDNDKLWIRGDNDSEWIEVATFQNDNIEGWRNITIYNIEDLLADNNQNVSNITQFRFGQEDNYDFLGGDGLIIDDVIITGFAIPKAEAKK